MFSQSQLESKIRDYYFLLPTTFNQRTILFFHVKMIIDTLSMNVKKKIKFYSLIKSKFQNVFKFLTTTH